MFGNRERLAVAHSNISATESFSHAKQEKNEAIPLQPVAATPSATIEVERKPIETPANRLIASTRPVEVAPSPKEPIPVNSPNVSENRSPASMGIRCDEQPRIRHDGVLISAMMPGGPADEAGMREGDWLLAIDDHYIYTVEELAAILQSHKPGDKVNVRYRRYATIYVTVCNHGGSVTVIAFSADTFQPNSAAFSPDTLQDVDVRPQLRPPVDKGTGGV